MRTIKFRAWDKQRKIMLPVYNIDFGADWINFSNEPKLQENIVLFEHLEIMQFTGLIDKNGKEIYEGDIVKDCTQHWDDHNTKLHDCTGFVKYLSEIDQAEYSVANDTDGIKVKNECYQGWFNLSNKVEVIGNIYENPELLK